VEVSAASHPYAAASVALSSVVSISSERESRRFHLKIEKRNKLTARKTGTAPKDDTPVPERRNECERRQSHDGHSDLSTSKCKLCNTGMNTHLKSVSDVGYQLEARERVINTVIRKGDVADHVRHGHHEQPSEQEQNALKRSSAVIPEKHLQTRH
jgi:hypothetical protein